MGDVTLAEPARLDELPDARSSPVDSNDSSKSALLMATFSPRKVALVSARGVMNASVH